MSSTLPPPAWRRFVVSHPHFGRMTVELMLQEGEDALDAVRQVMTAVIDSSDEWEIEETLTAPDVQRMLSAIAQGRAA